jgi:hypothetical protein
LCQALELFRVQIGADFADGRGFMVSLVEKEEGLLLLLLL